MRRGTILLFTTGLLLSHAGMAWLGKSAAGAARESAPSPQGATGPGESNTNPWTVSALRGRIAERERKQAAKAAEDEKHPEPTWLEEIEAARAAMPAGTDFAALLAKALEAMPPDGNDFSAEAVAAFGLWLERDPTAAMAWMGLTGRDRTMYDFDSELERWMKAGADRQLDDYLKRFPLATMLLMEAAGEVAEDRGPDYALELAATLTNAQARNEFLDSALDSDHFAGRLAKLRALMNDTRAGEFLTGEVRYMGLPAPDFLAEIRAAGFPPAALQEYEQWLANRTEEDAAEQAAAPTPEELAQRVREGSYSALVEALPDLREWCTAVDEGRLTPEELLSRAREAWPQAATAESRVRSFVATETMAADPVGTMRWLRETGTEEEWRKVLDGSLHGLNAEQMAAVLADLPPGTELKETSSGWITGELMTWLRSDPEAYAAAHGQMAGDERNQSFLKLMDEVRAEEEQRAASEDQENEDAVSGEGGGP